MAVACVGMAAERKEFGGNSGFRPSTGRNTPVSLVGVVIVKFAHAIARVLERVEIGAGKGVTFGMGVAIPFVASLPTCGSSAHMSLSHGSRDCGVVATSSIPQGVCCFHHGRGCLVVASSYRFSHGRWQDNKKHS